MLGLAQEGMGVVEEVLVEAMKEEWEVVMTEAQDLGVEVDLPLINIYVFCVHIFQ